MFHNIFVFKGINYAAIIHESRALTEQKQTTATPTILPET